jgi:hypothetical protein
MKGNQMARAKSRKRPCVICTTHFLPDVHLGDRQKTCGDPECKREWHRRLCEKYNKEHVEQSRESYLAKKLEKIVISLLDLKKDCHCQQANRGSIPKSRINLGLPRKTIQEVIGGKALIIVEYIVERIIQRYQKILQVQLAKIN